MPPVIVYSVLSSDDDDDEPEVSGAVVTAVPAAAPQAVPHTTIDLSLDDEDDEDEDGSPASVPSHPATSKWRAASTSGTVSPSRTQPKRRRPSPEVVVIDDNHLAGFRNGDVLV